jgi:hypothetical protein
MEWYKGNLRRFRRQISGEICRRFSQIRKTDGNGCTASKEKGKILVEYTARQHLSA